MLPHTMEPIKEVYQLALDLETYLQTPFNRKSAFKGCEKHKWQFENNAKCNTTLTRDVKGKL